MKLNRTITLALLALVVTVLWGIGPPQAQAIDDAKIPHYFGPYPNWALSPLPTVDPVTKNVSGGIRKFVDALPGLGATAANKLGQYLPVAVPDTTTYPGSDYYEIAAVQYRQKMHSDLPPTLLRGYVQLSTTNVPGDRVTLSNALVNGTTTPISGYTGVTPPNYLGPVIVATKGRPVRILFRNLLPTGEDGDLFLPADSTFMGAGMAMMMDPYDVTPTTGGSYDDAIRNPVCTQIPKDPMCFTDNRMVVHLHGGTSPWISDGTPHQWITPGGEPSKWLKGEGVVNVPDMPDPGPGAVTLFYSNQQSARLMFYHDHAWGTTRLNVYAGAAAGYEITDDTEKALVNAGVIPGDKETIPLIIQDRTFVPSDAQLLQNDLTDPANPKYAQDPTWDKTRWGGFGNLWYHHVYMPAQNPDDPSGMSAYGRWMYGPWFWPPATGTKYGPIANPRYNMDPATNFTTALATPCNIDDPTTWQYQVDPFCEPAMIPGTPNISAGMEQFNDTPIVNGTAYPTTTVDPKPYRLRILNAANDRFFNLQLYVADSTTASTALNANGDQIGGTEVAYKASELAAAQDDPNVFPTPDTTLSPVGPSWIQIASEGGFLPTPAVIPPQPITWIIDPTRFDFGNVDKHSLVVAPAERADVIVDFSQYAGKTLILYNDAPAAYPARVASYDYYTGQPDLSPVGAPGVLPGYGPNTRTIMQIKVKAGTGTPFNMTALTDAFTHTNAKPSTFEVDQHPIIVGQAAYNSAYGTTFPSASWCNAPGSTKTSCDGLARISEQGGDLFGFNTLANPTVKMQIPLQPKALHDEMNAATFDDYGRMTANMGVETVPSSAGNQAINLMGYIFPPTEVIDATNLPTTDTMTPLGTTPDGSQIWKITHNGVDTHPIHFHLYDVQVINRVTWDNIIIKPDANELGWKDTVRISPLEDTIVALRPVIPVLPFDLPNSVRLLDPTRPDGAPISLATTMIAANTGLIPPTDPSGQPIDLYNHTVNFGAEYVWHCHILSHEEMDMMRPVAVALPPVAPANLVASVSGTGASTTLTLSWADKSLSETGWEVQRAPAGTATWTTLATIASTTGPTNTDTISYTYPLGADATTYTYRVRAINVVGDTWNYANSNGFPTVTATSGFSNTTQWPPPPTLPAPSWAYVAPTKTTTSVAVSWGASAVAGVTYVIQESTDPGFATVTGQASTTSTMYTFTSRTNGTYYYRVQVTQTGWLNSPWTYTGPCTVTASAPAPPWAYVAPTKATPSVAVSWGASSLAGVTYIIQESSDSAFTTITGQASTTVTSYTFTGRINGTYYYRVKATFSGLLDSSWTNTGPCSVNTQVPAPQWMYVAPTKTIPDVAVSWGASSLAGVTYVIEESTSPTFTTITGQASTSATGFTFTGRTNGTYYYRVKATLAGMTDSTWTYSGSCTVTLTVPAPTWIYVAPTKTTSSVSVSWGASTMAGVTYVLQESTTSDFAAITGQLSTTGTLGTFTGRTNGTYYYRVKATANGYNDSAWINSTPCTVTLP